LKKSNLFLLALVSTCIAPFARADSPNSCAEFASLKIDGVEITKAASVPAGTTLPPPYPGASTTGPLPAHCRIDGVIHSRKGVHGEDFGIGFALALPEAAAWNADFMMQGGAGANGSVGYPIGASYSGKKPALVQGFAVASTDTGHKAKSGGYDFSFMRDQQVQVQVTHLLPNTAYHLEIHRTGYHANDAYFEYIEMGSPNTLATEQVERLNGLTRDLPEADKIVESGSTGALELSVPMNSNDVVLVKLDRTK